MQARESLARYRLGASSRPTPHLRLIEGTDLDRGTPVVMEVCVAPAGEAAAHRADFLAGVARLSALSHPSLPTIVDAGIDPDGRFFLVRAGEAGRDLDALAGEAPAQLVALLLQAVDGLDLAARHGLAHGALSVATLRLVQEPDGPGCRLAGFVHGLAEGALRPGAVAELRAADVRDLARVACALLGAGIEASPGREPEVSVPLAVAFELDDAETLRRVLERCLRSQPAERPAGWGQVREALARALGRPAAGGAESPVRLTFSTEPDPLGAGESSGREVGEETGEITRVVLLEAVADGGRDPEATGASDPEVTAVRRPDDTAVPFVPRGDQPREPAPVAAPEAPPPAITAPPPVAATPPSPATPRPFAPAPRAQVAPPKAVPVPAPASPMPSPPAAVASSPPVAPMAAPVPPPAAAPRAGRRRRWLLPAIAAAAGLAVAIAGALLLAGRSPAPAPPGLAPAAAPVPVPPPAAPLPGRIDPILLQARAMVGNGDDAAAADLLADLAPEAEHDFGAAECHLAAVLSETLSAVAWQRAAADLEAGLASGDPGALRRAVTAVGAREEPFLDRYPEARGGLRLARRVLALDERARAALGEDPIEVLEYAAVLVETFPRYQAVGELRDRAADAIVAGAEAAAADGRLQDALDRLMPLDRAWPERPGLAGLIADYRSRLRARRDLEELLTAAGEAGERGRPDEGLALLAGISPGPQFADRLAALRAALTRRLAELDAKPPELTLVAGGEIVRDETATVALRVTDDFRVEEVTVQVRPEGGSWRTLPVRRTGGEVVVEIPPAVHLNKDLALHATAADISGHEGRLGSPDQPLQLKRRRWFHRFRGE